MFMVLPRLTFGDARKRRNSQAILIAAVAASCFACEAPISVARAEGVSGAVSKPAAPFKPSANDKNQPTVVIPATIQAFFVTDLYAKDSGFVSQLNNDIGDHVKKGQVLAVIDDPELQAQFDKAQAAVQQTQATLEVAKRQLAGMQADLVLQQVTLKRQRELFAGRAATAQTLDEARAKESVSSATVETGKAKITLAEADLEAAKAELERLRALLQYDKIIAPFDCVVTRRLVNLGDLVQAATATRTAPLFTCQELDVVRVFADAPEASATGIHPGLSAEIKLHGPAGLTVRGSVTRIANGLDAATRTMRIEIDVPNPDGKLLPGMYAEVTLTPQVQQAEP
jgi:multidrug efflux pump subunit AcrA (membrane-fusion protein)